jgi:DTW domain-containing protein YfiP
VIPSLQLRTRLCLVVHAKELKRTTNTGRLACHALVNSEMRIRGLRDAPLDLQDVVGDPSYYPLLFFPSPDAEDLQDVIPSLPEGKPVQLIVPDGNWRQASKVPSRHPELASVQRVMIKAANEATYHLRAETTKEGMATLQAIAEAMGILEGSEAKAALRGLYEAKLAATLIGRGQRFRDG